MSVTRRQLLGNTALGVLAATLPGLLEPAAASGAARPNFLWFVSEDNNPYVGAYGDTLAHTPNIDAFAREGVVFEVAYSPAPVCAPSRFTYLTGVHAESVGPAHHMRATAALPGFIKGFPEYLRQAGYYTTNNSKTDYNANVDMAATWNESSDQAHWTRRPAGAPFFAVFTSMTTHESSLFQGLPSTLTPPEAVVVPPYLPDTLETRVNISAYYRAHENMDRQFGERLRELETQGVAEDTIVFYFGDNGGSLPWSKRFSNERGHHIPLVVRIPEKWAHLTDSRPGDRVSAPVGGIDFAPTTLALAGLPVPDHFQGTPIVGQAVQRAPYTFGQRSRMDERHDLQRTVRSERYAYTRNYQPWRPYGQYVAYMWQQRSYQVWHQAHLDGTLTEVQDRFWRPKPHEELYDVAADPHLLTNLATDPAYAAVLEEHRVALDAHLVETNDNGFLPEGHPLEGWEASRVPGAYPLVKIAKVAALAGKQDPADADRFAGYLVDAHDVVRYWAAQGFLGLGAAAAPRRSLLAGRFDAESSVHVKVVLAEALGALGSASHVAWLAGLLPAGASPQVVLQAINALTWVPRDLVAPHREAVRNAEIVGASEYIRFAARHLGELLDGTFNPAVARAW